MAISPTQPLRSQLSPRRCFSVRAKESRFSTVSLQSSPWRSIVRRSSYCWEDGSVLRRSSSQKPRMTPSGLLISWATPAASVPEAGELLGVHELPLQVLGLGHVARDAQDGADLAGRALDRHEVGADPHRAALERQLELLAQALARGVHAPDEVELALHPGLREGRRQVAPDELLRVPAEEVRREGVHGLEAAVAVDREDEVLRAFDERAVVLLGLGERVGLGDDHRLEHLAPAVLDPVDGGPAQDQRQDHDPDQGQKTDRAAVQHVLDLGFERHHGDRPQRRGVAAHPHRAVGDELAVLPDRPAVPGAVVPPGPLLAPQHLLLLDEVDPLGGHLGEALLADGEGVVADEVRVGVVEEDAPVVDHPGVAGFAGGDVAHQPGQQGGEVQRDDDHAGGVRVGRARQAQRGHARRDLHVRHPGGRVFAGPEPQPLVRDPGGDGLVGARARRRAGDRAPRGTVDQLRLRRGQPLGAGEVLSQQLRDRRVRFGAEQARGDPDLVPDLVELALDAGPQRLRDHHLLGVELLGHHGADLAGRQDPHEEGPGHQRHDGGDHDGRERPAGRCVFG